MKSALDRETVDALGFLLRLGVGAVADAMRAASNGSQTAEAFGAASLRFESFERRLLAMDDERRAASAKLQEILTLGKEAGEAARLLAGAVGFNPRQLCAVARAGQDEEASAIFRAMANLVLTDLRGGLAIPQNFLRPSLAKDAALKAIDAAILKYRGRDPVPIEVFADVWRIALLLASLARGGWSEGVIVSALTALARSSRLSPHAER